MAEAPESWSKYTTKVIISYTVIENHNSKCEMLYMIATLGYYITKCHQLHKCGFSSFTVTYTRRELFT